MSWFGKDVTLGEKDEASAQGRTPVRGGGTFPARASERLRAAGEVCWGQLGAQWSARLIRRDWMPSSHIGAQLAITVLLTGALTFAAVGLLAALRVRADLSEQAGALEQLSRAQVARRLDSDAGLAKARLAGLFTEAERQTRFLAQRVDITKAAVSANNVLIGELLAPAAVTGGLDGLFVTDTQGIVIGANAAGDLLAVMEAFVGAGLRSPIENVLANNARSHRRTYHNTLRLPRTLSSTMGLPPAQHVGRVMVEAMFDDFGDVVGALVGVRVLAKTEQTFSTFSELVDAGVLIIDGGQIVSAAGVPIEGSGMTAHTDSDELIPWSDGSRLARCVADALDLRICAHVDAAEVKAAQQGMLRIGAAQASSLFVWFLVLAAGSLGIIVAVVLAAVKRVTAGLPQLSTAAAAVASGDLDRPFAVIGTGEVRSLGQAFELMLSNLRDSLGRIRQLAFYDGITGLANREKMRLDGMAALAAGGGDLAFLFIDLDRFKSINDTFGHNAGDVLLRSLASRVNSFFEMQIASGTLTEFWLGRIGGDEFLVIVRGRLVRDDLQTCAEALIGAASQGYELGTAHVTVGASVGIAIAGVDGVSYDDLLISADIAMYEAKRQGRSCCAFFTLDAAAVMAERLSIEKDLRWALKNRALSVHYQPKVSLVNGRVVGAEALVRWSHPERGYISAAKFIPIAEEAALISELGLFVLERSLQEFGALLERGFDATVAVNVSVLQLEDANFVEMVETLLAAQNFPPHRLELEITESVAMRDSDVVQSQMSRLRARGIRFSIDDFGTGYSNLATLARLPIDTLKLDRSLVNGVAQSVEQQTIVRTVISLAKSFGFETVAEGLEQEADLDFLVSEKADLAQGYYFSPAVPIENFEAILDPSNWGVRQGELGAKLARG